MTRIGSAAIRPIRVIRVLFQLAERLLGIFASLRETKIQTAL